MKRTAKKSIAKQTALISTILIITDLMPNLIIKATPPLGQLPKKLLRLILVLTRIAPKITVKLTVIRVINLITIDKKEKLTLIVVTRAITENIVKQTVPRHTTILITINQITNQLNMDNNKEEFKPHNSQPDHNIKEQKVSLDNKLVWAKIYKLITLHKVKLHNRVTLDNQVKLDNNTKLVTLDHQPQLVTLDNQVILDKLVKLV